MDNYHTYRALCPACLRPLDEYFSPINSCAELLWRCPVHGPTSSVLWSPSVTYCYASSITNNIRVLNNERG
jgi:hypothetical protein